ncbi:3-oxoacyl-ACP synthase III [Streptomyces bingchenggensis BCW-1]|uniref:3-oxoacyl-ACP synthase III n=1 Tax=Streptomyces bingchenggensis (strain BCW-1) TaxID=749414 RepID=D7CCY3_STRBB|nr:3-oxoacyl-ACP synthase III [Streptomyces bingchenggensis BCW-1]
MYIAAVGTYLPDSVSVTEAVRQGRLDAAEAERSGLLGAAVAGDTPAPEMGVRAVRTALGRWGGDISELGLLLYVEGYRCGPDGWLPQSYVMREAVGGDLLAVGVRQGCNGVFGALELAAAHLRGGGSEAALIVAADNMGSPLVDRWRASPGYLLADGAAALVLTRSAGFARLLSVNSKAVPELEALHRGIQPLDPSGSARPVPLELGARQREFLGGDDAPKDWMLRVMKAQGELMAKTLEEAGIAAEDMTRVVTAHANQELVDAWLSSLGRTLEQSAWSFGRRVGHLMAGDQLASFEHLLMAGEIGPGDRVLLVGSGPGLGIAAAVVELTALPPWVPGPRAQSDTVTPAADGWR